MDIAFGARSLQRPRLFRRHGLRIATNAGNGATGWSLSTRRASRCAPARGIGGSRRRRSPLLVRGSTAPTMRFARLPRAQALLLTRSRDDDNDPRDTSGSPNRRSRSTIENYRLFPGVRSSEHRGATKRQYLFREMFQPPLVNLYVELERDLSSFV